MSALVKEVQDPKNDRAKLHPLMALSTCTIHRTTRQTSRLGGLMKTKPNATKKPSIDVLQDSALLLPSAFSGPTRGVDYAPSTLSTSPCTRRLQAFRTSLFCARAAHLKYSH